MNFLVLANEAKLATPMPKKSIFIGSASETGAMRVMPANAVENTVSVANVARANDIFSIFPTSSLDIVFMLYHA